MRPDVAGWWMRLVRREFCFECDRWTVLVHSHVAHPNRPGRSR